MVRKKRFTVQIQALTIQNQKTAGNSTVEKLSNEKTVETSLGGDEMKFNPRLYYHQKWFKPKYKNPLLRYLYEKEKQTPKKRNLKKDKIRDLQLHLLTILIRFFHKEARLADAVALLARPTLLVYGQRHLSKHNILINYLS